MSYGVTPKLSYNGTDFLPTYANRHKIPIDNQHAIRHDSITTSGLQQSVLERIDRVLTLDFENIPESDLSGWDAFLSLALAGNQFQYYPDSTMGANEYYYLVDMDGAIEWVSFENYKLSLKLRRVITAEIGS